jgi:hypothetical protein
METGEHGNAKYTLTAVSKQDIGAKTEIENIITKHV